MDLEGSHSANITAGNVFFFISRTNVVCVQWQIFRVNSQVMDNLFPVKKANVFIDTRGGSNKCCWFHETLEQGLHHAPALSLPELGALQTHYPPLSSGEYHNIVKCLCAVIFHWCRHNCQRRRWFVAAGQYLCENDPILIAKSNGAQRPLITAYQGENLRPISLKLLRFTAVGLFCQCTAIKWHQPVTS